MKSQFSIFIFLLIIFGLQTSKAQTDVSGAFFSNTTWNISGSPYNLIGDIGIPLGITLTIQPGVKITYNGDYQIIIQGAIVANGIDTLPIFFNGCSGGNNPMLMFKGANLSNSSLNNLQFYGPKPAVQLANESEQNEDPIKNSGILIIYNALFSNSNVITHGYQTSASLILNKTTIIGSRLWGVYPCTEPITLKSSFIDNCIINSDPYNYGINFDSSTVSNSSLLIGCCGANISFNHSKIISSEITEGWGTPVGGPLSISNSELDNVPINLPTATVNISKSIINNTASNGIIFGNGAIASVKQMGNNTGIAFEITGYSGYQIGGYVSITNSTISENAIGMKISNANSVVMDSCNFISNSVFNLQNLSSSGVTAKNNWWDTTNTAAIASKIYDYYDNINVGQVAFSNYLASQQPAPAGSFNSLNLSTGSTFTIAALTSTITSSGTTTFCQGSNVTLTASSGSSFLWSNNETTQSIVVSSSGNYSVTVTPSMGCSQISSGTDVVVFQQPVLNVSDPASVCFPNTVDLTANSITAGSTGVGLLSYWMDTSATNTLLSPNTIATSGTYYIKLTASGGCLDDIKPVNTIINSLPIVGFSGLNSVLCFNDSIKTLTGFPAGGIFSGVGISNNSFNPSIAGSGMQPITYTYVDGNNCSNIDSQITQVLPIPAAPSICMVTVDNTSTNNIIYWDKASYTNVDSFIVYRETLSNTYKRVGAVSMDSLSLLVDTVRNLYFPFSGNPNSGTYRYKLQVRDTCGNYSPMSAYHNTIFINQTGGTFTFNDYQIEGEISPIPELNAYYLWRDNSGSGNWALVNGVSGSQLTIIDPDYLSYPNARWHVETVWNISCSPTRAISTSRSNNKGLSDEVTFSISPNPYSENTTLSYVLNKTSDIRIEVYNTTGQKVQTLVNAYQIAAEYTYKFSAKANGDRAGIYFVKIMIDGKSVIKKVVELN
ncbi:MAG: T9SS type A sorting domain-containing protein [Bacteroidia bacterium]|nr:T9SS type A sorting domain-containing protein [Bacteroidia bacterium]